MCVALRPSCSTFVNNLGLTRQPVDKHRLVLDLSPNLSHAEPPGKAATGLINKTTVFCWSGARQGFFVVSRGLPPVSNDFGASQRVKSGPHWKRLPDRGVAKRGVCSVFGMPGRQEPVRIKPVEVDQAGRQCASGRLKTCWLPFFSNRPTRAHASRIQDKAPCRGPMRCS